jgi:Ala-tRNA(Pro) deacylase
MGVAATIQDYLDSHGVAYKIIEHPHTETAKQTAEVAHIPAEQLAKCVLLGDDANYLLAVIPANHRLDLDRLNQVMARSLEVVEEDEVSMTFGDCQAGAIPAVGEAYGVDTVLDAALSHQQVIYFEAGDHTHLVQMEGAGFRLIMEHVPRVQVSHHL